MGKFQEVIQQIEAFIRKYYKNEMIKGVILFSGVLLGTYLVVTGLEYVGRFSSITRLFLLISFIGVNAFLFVKYLLIPILKLKKVARSLTVWEASDMIGKFFPDIADKLKNTLQLEKDLSTAASLNLELVKASIEQRSTKLSVIPFSSAIDLRENKKYAKFFGPIVLVFVVVAFINPSWFLDGSERVLNFNKEYVEPAPFQFYLNSDKTVVEGEDYKLEVKLEGNELPDEVKIVSSLGTYNLQKESKTLFTQSFTNLSQPLNFYCEANGFKSENFGVDILYKPVLEDISLKVIYPKHTGLQSADFDNTGNISVPEGSIVNWTLSAKNLESVQVNFVDSTFTLLSSLTNSYSFKRQFFRSEDYHLVTSSSDVKNADSMNYTINVIKDAYPTISVEESIDSMNSLYRYVEGIVGDDYGFRSLSGTIKVTTKDTSYNVTKGLKINPKSTSQLFSYYVDLSLFKLGPGDRIDYYFTVTDNDEINGFKSSTSTRRTYQVPSLDQLENDLSAKAENLEDELSKTLKEAEDLKKQIEDLRSEMLNKESLDWKDKQNLENLLQTYQSLNEKLENLQQQYQQQNNERENFLEESEEIKEKREQLQKLMEELMDEEMIELMKELEELLNEMNKDDLIQNLDQMQEKSENLSEELDRTLELFKMMEINQKLESLEQQLLELAEEQRQLEELTENKKISPEELSAKQDSLNKKFEEIQKDMDEIEQKNSELQNPMDINFNQEMEQNISDEMNDSKENLDNNNRNKSQENQNKAADMMEQMANDVSAMQMQMGAQQQGEDMEALRYLLENIVALSKRQEALMNEMKVTSPTDPYYSELSREQQEIENASQVVSDSLIALSKRVFQLSSFINEELADLDYNLEKSIDYSEEHKTSEANQSQQYVMTTYNDLALMLAEVLSEMQEQMKSQMQGNGSCSKPGGSGQGGGKMSMEQMKQMLQDQINQMKGGQNSGGKEGENKQGNGQGQGQIPGLSNEQIVKMAAQQSQIRESLQQMKEDLNQDGSGAGNGLNELIEEIDQLEKDLLNGNIGPDFVKRQQDILTRLLEHEKAQRERGYSEERESNEGKNTDEGNLIEFTEYNRKKNAEAEFLKSLPIGLQVYYKNLVNDYFNSVNQ